ncbi:hypothetical protein LB506_001716 [Fusarium annulatum]|nr:hypothetical protein LB506_001716 [Fusarium annulatum]
MTLRWSVSDPWFEVETHICTTKQSVKADNSTQTYEYFIRHLSTPDTCLRRSFDRQDVEVEPTPSAPFSVLVAAFDWLETGCKTK